MESSKVDMTDITGDVDGIIKKNLGDSEG